MKFDPNTGDLEIMPKIKLFRGMRRTDLYETRLNWENWRELESGEAVAYRTIFTVLHFEKKVKAYLIVYMKASDGPISGWDLVPSDGMEGHQKRPEGKYTKRLRSWFKDVTGVSLPVQRDWVDIDACFDPHNLMAVVICSYPERFKTEEEWQSFLKL